MQERCKRPPNAYMLYCIEMRTKLLASDPSLDHRSVMAKLGETWNSLSEEERMPYRNTARELQVEFKQNNPMYRYKKHKSKSDSEHKKNENPKVIKETPVPYIGIASRTISQGPPIIDQSLILPLPTHPSPTPVLLPQQPRHLPLFPPLPSLDPNGFPVMPPAPVLPWMSFLPK